MAWFHIIKNAAIRFRQSASGATAVEFVIVLPVMLVCFALIVEGSRIYWNYQAAVGGVRDAARYLARVNNNDLCVPASASTFDSVAAAVNAKAIVERNMKSGSGTAAIFPSAVTLSTATPVSATLQCVEVTGLAGDVPVVRVNATVVVTLPLSNLLRFFEATPNGQMTSTITDQSRIYGL